MSLGRCNYCQRPAVVRLTWRAYCFASRRKWTTVHARSCAEHVGCVNWRSTVRMYPDAKVERAPGDTEPMGVA